MAESVWDYPRPPRLESTTRHVVVTHRGVVVAESRRPWRVLETSHPPVFYLPADDVRTDLLTPNRRRTVCEWKGQAAYVDLTDVTEVAWFYPSPNAGFAPIAGAYAFYASRVDRCTVDGEVVVPQPGRFYGGWITSDIEGPFKS